MVSPQTKRLFQKLGRGVPIELETRREEIMPRTAHKFREPEDFARVEITPSRLDMELAMAEPEPGEQMTISGLPSNVAHSLARHGIINLSDERPENSSSPLRTALRTPSKQQDAQTKTGVLQKQASRPQPEVQSIGISPNPLKVLRHFVKPENLESASSMLHYKASRKLRKLASRNEVF